MISGGNNMENDISPFFIIKKLREGEELRMDQKYLKIRMNSNKVMAIHYKAPKTTSAISVFSHTLLCTTGFSSRSFNPYGTLTPVSIASALT